MPEIIATVTPPERKNLDRQLLLSLALSPLAAGISTIVGFIVAHWITITAYKLFPQRDHFTCGAPGWEEVADFGLNWAVNPLRGELD